MMLARIRLAVLTVAGLAFAAGGAGVTLRAWAAPEPNRPQPVAAPAPPPPPAPPAADPMTLYAFQFDAENIREFADLEIDFGGVRVRMPAVTVVPIVAEAGVTGVFLLGRGVYEYAPKKGMAFQGTIHPMALLRFNPADLAAIVPLDRGKKVTDRGALELCRAAGPTLIDHCWQGGMRSNEGGRRQGVLIPPTKAFAAVVLSPERGDVLISTTTKTATVYSFTERKTLAEMK